MLKSLISFLMLCTFGYSYAIDGRIIQSKDQALQDKWYKTLGKTVPKISLAKTVFKNQELLLGIAVQNYATDKKGFTKVKYAIKIKNPYGDIYVEKKDLIAINSEIPNKDFVQLSEENFKMAFSFDDAFGIYEILVEITDQISGDKKLLTSNLKLEVLPSYHSFGISENETFSEWMINYKNTPEPEKALKYFLLFSQSELIEKDENLLPVLTFFTEIFSTNKYLFASFSDAYENADDKSRKLLALLAYQSLGENQFKNYIKEPEILTMVKGFEVINPYSTINSGVQMDMLWSEYEASGKQKPILHLISALEYAKFSGATKKFQNSKKVDDQEEAYKEILFQTAVWSLESHIKNDYLVLNYANYILAYENLSKIQKLELGKILRKFN